MLLLGDSTVIDECKNCDRSITDTWGHHGTQLCGYCKYLAYVWKKYRLSKSDYEQLLLLQGNRCAICRSDDLLKVVDLDNWKKPKLFVDHDHGTGVVRGLLCLDCNQGLGKLGDSLQGLRLATQYLVTDKDKDQVV